MTRRRASARPLHLLEFGLRWPPEAFLYRKLDRLTAHGFRVTVATTARRVDRRVRLPGVRVASLVPNGSQGVRGALGAARGIVALGWRSPRRALAAVRASATRAADGRAPDRGEAVARVRAYSRLAALPSDVIHFEWGSGAVRHFALVDLLRCPVVVSCRGSEINIHPHTTRSRAARAVTQVFHRAAAVHCVSAAIRREAERYGLDPAKAHLIRPAVDTGFFTPAAAAPHGDALRIVSVGWLRWVKGYEYAVLTVAELVRRGIPVSLTIVGGDTLPDVGEPSERGRIVHAVADLGLDGRVRLLGHVTPEDVREELRRSHVLLHTSLSEGLPNVVLEAMACALPVVVTDVGGTTEAVRDGVDGIVVPPRDPAAAAGALVRLWRDPDLRAAMGRAGRERVETEFRLDAHGARWAELYRQVAGRAVAA